MKHFIFILPFISFLLYAEENLSELLEIYQKKSDLSNITKKESAGFLDLYTRDDLEKMQAHNLIDVLKTLSSLYITRGQNNTYHFYKPSSSKMPLPSIRLYINDHDMSSTTFGSAFLIWGEMPISYIDHIEVYKSVSSIEFGNETATLLIRLYTKDASRENGGKFQTFIDNYGSYDTSFYYAQTFENDFSYFAYIQKDNINREVYHNYYNNKEYDFNSDKKGYNFYANLSYKNWRVELGNYKKRNDSFIGIGIHKTPDGGELKARQSYIHVTKKFDNGIKLQIAFDDMVYRRTYFDENDIAIYNGYMDSINYVQDYYIKFHDQIFSTIIEKIYKTENNKILLGGFYKYKSFKTDEEFINYKEEAFSLNDSYENSLNLFSLYIEDTYDLNKDTRVILSAKGDFYNYDKKVASQDEYIFRAGVVKNIYDFQFKFFYTSSYITATPIQLYNNNTPYRTNPDLDYPDIRILTASLRYKIQNHIFDFIFAKNRARDLIVYKQGYINADIDSKFSRYELQYTYTHDLNNKLMASLFYAQNSQDVVITPKYGINLRVFNKYKSFDIYNEFIYRDSYTSYYAPYLKLDASLDWTASIKYHYNKDLSIGLRAENIFNKSYKVVYKNLDEAIQVIDRKTWVSMEYTF